MRACPKCFNSPSWIANATPPDSATAQCNFGHQAQTHTFSTSAWLDAFVGMCGLYELTDDPTALSFPARIQEDWRIFSFNDETLIVSFLSSSGLDSDLINQGVRVRLKASSGDSPDHVASWAQFSQEIRTTNRYFPRTVLNINVLETALFQTATEVSVEAVLYRARASTEPVAHAPGDMGAPPPRHAREGRANPVGIPYLYLAFERETCLDEMRPIVHSLMTVGRFTLARDLRVMNLYEVPPLDYFEIREIDDVGEQAQRLAYHRYLVELGRELSRPVRSSDTHTDYIPTQYLCELSKSVGFDGVMYGSAVHENGRNIVLFDTTIATCHEVDLVSATTVTATWQPVSSAS